MPQYFQTWTFAISAITLGNPTIITVTVPSTTNLNYSIGQQARLLIPPTFGCRQLNGLTGYVTSVTLPDQVTLSIDSSMNVDPFILSSAITQAQLVPVGDINNGTTNANGRSNTGTFIPGSFLDISPA